MSEHKPEFTRRNDIGQKILIGIVLGGFGMVMGLFVNTLLTEADAGKTLAYENRVELREHKADMAGKYIVISNQYMNISSDMSEIKQILKRTSPYERELKGGLR
jgi:hypothetical protein